MIATDPPAKPPLGGFFSRSSHRSRLLAVAAVLAVVIAAAVVWVRPRLGPGAEQLRAEAEADARAGRNERAASTLARLARLRAPTPVDRLLRAQVDASRGRTDAALAELAAIPDGHPLAPLARLSQGQLEARRGRLRRAEAAFRATLALTPNVPQARRELVYIYSIQQRLHELDEQLDALSAQGSIDPQHLLHWGLVRHSEWSAAADIAPLKRYVAADPEDRHSRLALAEAQWRTGRPAEAEATLAPLPASDPDARAARARLALDRGDRSAARALLAEGPAGHPALARLRGRLALTGGDPREAVRQLRLALAADPDDRAATQSLAIALAAAGDPAAASLQAVLRRDEALRELFLRARTDGLRDATLPRQIGLACADAGRPSEARAWLNLALSRAPTDSQTLAALHRLDQAAEPHPRP